MRTRYTFYNFLVSIISGIVIPVLGFVKVRLFIAAYGDELNGLYLVFNNVITDLNICELSFSLAFRQLLFKPLADGDKEEVNRIYSGVTSIYHKVGLLVIVLAFVLAFIVPLFNRDTIDMSLWEMAFLFLIMALPFGISYFLLPPSLVIMADQKEYQISVWIQTIAIIRMFLMIIVILLKLPYVLIFIIEGLNVFLSNFFANRIAKKHYPWLNHDKKIRTNPEFVESSRSTMVQRLSNIAITSSDNIIINTTMDLTSVSIFGSYSYLIEAALRIINSAITSPINSFGNLFSSDSEDSYPVFEEFYEFSCYLATILAVCIFVVLDEFVYLWVHKASYVLPISASIIFALNVFYLTQRESIILIRDANRLFVKAKKNAYLMTAVKIVLSFVLVRYFGVIGVLLGTLIAYGTVDLLFNPKLVYEEVFHKDAKIYYGKFAVHLAIAALMAVVCYFVYQKSVPYIGESLIHFAVTGMGLGISVVILTTVIYYSLFPSFRKLVLRGKILLLRKAK